MPLKLREGVKVRTLSRKGTGAEKLGIWDSSIKRALEDIEISIKEAKGRYFTEGGAAAADNPVDSLQKGDKQNPHTKPFASLCWKPERVSIYETVDGKKVKTGDKIKIDPATNEEILTVTIKCKNKIVDILADEDGNPREKIALGSNDLIGALEDLHELVSNMDQDDEDGVKWYDVAVRQAYPKREKDTINDKGISKKYAHCMEADKWVEIGKVEKKSKYPTTPF